MTFGSYKVVRELGKGGMSEVYEVENVRLGSRHALKLFTYSGDVVEVRDRFLAEGRLLAQLSHPRIVRVTDVGVDEASGRPYFVMDLIVQASGEPCTLADVPPGGADEREIARWYEDLREGLAYIHGKGVIHRDLKLQNVLIGPDGHAVITDFGISKIRSKDLGEKVDPVQTIVRMRDGKNPLMGSLGYMAPELEMGQSASEASDWYSLGVLVFKLLTGVWYDAHMAVRETLETYDPVWLQILPKLLHANPQGRECLSWTELKEAADEEAAIKAEDELAGAKAKARHLYWTVGVSLILLLASLAVTVALGLRRESEIPDFDSTVRIPQNVLPSKSEQYELARIDAWVLTHDIFSNLKRGEISCNEAVQQLDNLAKCAIKEKAEQNEQNEQTEQDEQNEQDTLEARFPDYDELKKYSIEDSDQEVLDALVQMLSNAVTNLQERVQK